MSLTSGLLGGVGEGSMRSFHAAVSAGYNDQSESTPLPLSFSSPAFQGHGGHLAQPLMHEAASSAFEAEPTCMFLAHGRPMDVSTAK